MDQTARATAALGTVAQKAICVSTASADERERERETKQNKNKTHNFFVAHHKPYFLF
jgi:hypothetical protein